MIQTKGQGHIHVAVSLWEQIGKPETSEDWHKALMLPDEYEIVSIEHVNGLVDVLVSHECIPVIDEPPLPFVHPVYVTSDREGVRTVTLARIDISVWSEESSWQRIPDDGKEWLFASRQFNLPAQEGVSAME